MKINFSEEMSLSDFYEILDKHDWWYYFSDDMKVYNKGEVEEDKIKKFASKNPERLKLFLEYKSYMDSRVSGVVLNKPSKPKE
jgi:hypothetical protein